MTRTRNVLVVAVGLGAACAAPRVAPVPWEGAVPRRIAVWPAIAGDFAAHEAVLLADLDRALRQWGYEAPALAVGRQLLVDAGIDPRTTDPAVAARAIGDALGVDAVLRLDVHGFAIDDPARPHDARWDLAHSIVSTRDGREQWRFEQASAWQRAAEQPFDPLVRLDDDMPRVAPIGGDGSRQFRDERDLVRTLHQCAFARLPRCPR
ncbi:MAG: hypothetical protein U1E73_07270 [Planctomycetota bacterium]